MAGEDISAAVWTQAGRKPCKPGGGPRAASLTPEDLVGRRVRIWWRDDHVWYKGTITDYDTRKGKHTVTYDDDDLETLDMKAEIWRLIDDTPSSEKGLGTLSRGSEDNVKVGVKRKSGALGRGHPSSDKNTTSENPVPLLGAKSDAESPRRKHVSGPGRKFGSQRKFGKHSRGTASCTSKSDADDEVSHLKDDREKQQTSSQESDTDHEEETAKGDTDLAHVAREQVDPKREFVMQGCGFQVHRTQQPPAYELFCQLPTEDLSTTKVQQGDHCVILSYQCQELDDEEDRKEEDGGGHTGPPRSLLQHCKLVVNIPDPVGEVMQCVLTADGRLYVQVEWKQQQQRTGAMEIDGD